MFLWKACNEALPVKASLFRRHIAPDPVCFICNQDEESVYHLLLGCPWTRAVWLSSQLHVQHLHQGSLTVKDWLTQLVIRLQENSEDLSRGLTIVAYYLWGIWKERNECHFQQRPPDPLGTTIRIRASMLNGMEDNTPSPIPTQGRKPNYQARWDVPPPWTLKLNVDATYFKETCKGSIAVVVFDEKGTNVLSHSKTIWAASPLAAEALAVREALLLAMNLELPKIYLVSDCLNLVSLIRERRTDWKVEAVLRDIQD
ncbi:uncharacterized protein LOC130743760 [Lotus japonicus]|uniref:uncharacterized protein LOC130743760 n=1 Tax=Lotus japonicus TaxID=34305 RepID=UPI00258AAFD7|nr:uncharacterized protein LOC130743760 [Lotus japonicus]